MTNDALSMTSDFFIDNSTSIRSRFLCRLHFTQHNILLITIYTLIFCLSVTGNCLVIVTIVQQRWMRTVTNFYLLNLAIADLLLSVICMPPTLISIMVKCFFFGEFVCKALSYLQRKFLMEKYLSNTQKKAK